MDRICLIAMVLALLLSLLIVGQGTAASEERGRTMGYEDTLFDSTRVHTVDIVMDGWEEFLEAAQEEEYASCSVVIDGKAVRGVGIRAKGNTSLSSVAAMGSSRYSFKIEFDHYDAGKTYRGLDKLSLNNLIQDNTMMKDFLTYRMMDAFGVEAPLCSYAYLTVNGADWGLYLAVEGVEESFLERNYGTAYGELYKPDSTAMGGGRGNGKDFEFPDAPNGNDPSVPAGRNPPPAAETQPLPQTLRPPREKRLRAERRNPPPEEPERRRTGMPGSRKRGTMRPRAASPEASAWVTGRPAWCTRMTIRTAMRPSFPAQKPTSPRRIRHGSLQPSEN